MAKKTYFPYSWTIDDEQDECTLIRSYGLDENNKSICVIIKDFTPYIYVELPRHIEWTETRAQLLTNKIDDLHKLAKALLIYETLSGDEIRDLILRDIKPTRSFKDEREDDGKASSALGSLGLKPKPAI